jgi:putative ABC transport system permease protein
MWKTSLIQFLKSIQQNKFFTFLNLFGVSITIAIILIAAIKMESVIWPGGPEENNRNMLFVKNEVLRGEDRMSMGGINLALIEDYMIKFESPAQIAFSSETPWSYFGENGVEEYDMLNVNAGWWDVFDYAFIDGRPFNQQEVDNANMLAVIDKKVKTRFFGDKNAVGKMLEIAGKNFKIIGVIENVPANCQHASANIFVPYTLTSGHDRDLMHTGSFTVTFLAKDKANLSAIKNEFEDFRNRIVPLLDEGHKAYFGGPNSPLDDYLIGWKAEDEYAGRGWELFYLVLKVLLIMLLPALNLISIQLIRIHERSEEIGVRKAFGASRGELIKQILYENTLLAFLGAILGLLMALAVVYGFPSFVKRTLFNEIGTDIQLQINYGLFFICLLSSLVLSLISGIVPAIKMSKLNPVDVLKGGEL